MILSDKGSEGYCDCVYSLVIPVWSSKSCGNTLILADSGKVCESLGISVSY